jgi:hypothetical protein
VWLEPDGRYRAIGRSGTPSDGAWKLSDDQICLKQAHPFSVWFDYCTAIPPNGFKTGWIGKAYSGETVRISLKKGR